MHRTKKKSKTVKLPKPIKVKKEKSEEDRLPQPMTHYLDDRLEMVKQIFNTLKPKTIVNLAPDFLKTQALEEIEEACLNELLCISTKRLKSIITATKCPTDTESSDNDSDVERHEEHISLEEISSDSEIEGSAAKKAKKKKTSKNVQEAENGKKDANNDNNPADGQISVLELLELQARARAIRSQLALEPVTKIEVDSDEEKRSQKEKNKSSKKDDKSSKSDRKRFSSERESRDSAKISRTNGSSDNLNVRSHAEREVEKPTSKKIKLKRNYRSAENKETQERSDEHEVDGAKKADKERNEKTKSSEKAAEKEKSRVKEKLVTDIKKEKNSRSPSPDVIPIVAEPETLLITDSSDEEKNLGTKKTAEEKDSIEDTTLPQTEIGKDIRDIKDTSIDQEQGQENSAAPNQPEPLSTAEDNTSNDNAAENNTQDSLQCEVSNENLNEDSNGKNKQPKLSGKDKSKDGTNSANHSDDDQNDDVISLGGDLENEMNEQLENEVNAMQSPYNKKPTEDSSQDNNKSQDESQPEDVISLESSDEERAADNQSWHSRYMKSSKVSKVLAASRLGKRVRDNIKKTKHAKKTASHENSDAEKEKPSVLFASKHEDGSVEQYKELLEMRQRKSS